MFRIVVLIDNNNGATGLKSEHGLSILIETEKDGNLIFDFGASGAFRENAIRMGINLSVVSAGVLSHGHYDHSGGLKEFFRGNMFSKIYAHPNVLKERFSKKTGEYSGVEFDIKEYYTDRFIFENSVKEISDNVFFMGEIPFYEDLSIFGEISEDKFEDESVVVLKSRSGLTVITGCCHIGLYSVLKYVSEKFVGVPINAVIGGFHLSNNSKHNIESVKKALDEFSVNMFVAGHCTGISGLKSINAMVGNKLSSIYSGAVIIVD